MTQKQGVIIRLAVVLAVLGVLAGAAVFVYKTFLNPNVWRIYAEAMEDKKEGDEFNERGNWDEAHKKYLEADKKFDEILNKQANEPGVCERKGDIRRTYAEHFAQSDEVRTRSEAQNAAKWYGKSWRGYPEDQKISSAVKLCEIYKDYLIKYMWLNSLMSIKNVSDAVLAVTPRPQPGEKDYEMKAARWAEIEYYYAWSVKWLSQRRAAEIVSTSLEELGPTERIKHYEAVLADLDKAKEAYVTLTEFDTLPEDLTKRDIYLDLAETHLHRADVVLQVEQKNIQIAAQKADDARELAIAAFKKAREASSVDKLEDTIINEALLRNRYGRSPTEGDQTNPAEKIFVDAFDKYLTEQPEDGIKITSRIFSAAAETKMQLSRKAREKADEAVQAGSIQEADGFRQIAEKKKVEAENILKRGQEFLKDDPEMNEVFADFYIRNGEFDNARRQCEDVLKKDPSSQFALLRLVKIILNDSSITPEERGTQAKKHLETFLEHYKGDIDGSLYLGLAEQNLENYEEAEKVFKSIYDRQGTSERVRSVSAFYLGGLYRAWDKPEMAKKFFLDSIDIETRARTDWPNPYIALASTYIAQRHRQRAIEVYEHYLRNIQSRPGNKKPDENLMLNLASLYAAVGNHEMATEIVNRMRQDNPRGEFALILAKITLRNPGASAESIRELSLPVFGIAWKIEKKKLVEEQRVEWLFQIAQCHSRLGDREKIDNTLAELQDYLDSLKEWKDKKNTPEAESRYNSTCERIYITSYQTYRMPGMEIEKAIDAAEKLLKIKPGHPDYEMMMLEAQIVHMDPEESSRRIEEFLDAKITGTIDKLTKKLWLMKKGTFLRSRRRFNEAVEAYGPVLELYPEDYEANNAIAEIYLMRFSPPKPEAAEDYVQAMIKANPRDVRTIVMRAALRAAKEEDTQKRIKILEQAAEGEKDVPDLYSMLGEAYFKASRDEDLAFGEQQNLLEKAVSSFEKTVDLLPGDFAARYRLAQTLAYAAGIERQASPGEAGEFLRKVNFHLEKLLAAMPENFDVKTLQAMVAVHSGDMEKARDLMEDMAKRQEKAYENALKSENIALQRTLKIRLADLYRNLHAVCIRSDSEEEKEKAREYLDKADEYGKGTDPSRHLSISLTRANEFEGDNKPEEARKILKGLLEEFSEDPQLDPEVREAFAQFLQRRIVFVRGEATLPDIDSESAIKLKKEQDLLHEEFLSFIDASLEKYPAYFELQRQKAIYYAVITGEAAKAEAVLERLLAEERKREKPKANRFAEVAQFYASQPGIENNLEKAENRFLEAIQFDPIDLSINKMVINFYNSNKKVFSGKELEFTEKQLKEHPDVVMLKVFKADVLLEMEEYDRAIGLYKEVCRDKADEAEAYVGHARAVIARDGYERGSKKAIEILTDGARNAPFSSSIFNDLGTLYYGQGKFEEALIQFQKGKDNDRQALFYIARIRLMQIAEQSTRAKLDESIARARASAEAALSAAPNIGEAHRLLGMIALHEEKPEQAVKHFKRAVILTRDPLSFTQLTRLYFEYDWSAYAGDEDPARRAGFLDTYNLDRLKDWMESSFPQGEDNYALQLTRGRILLMRDESAAERRFKDAIRLTIPTNIEPYVYLDIYYLNRGNSTYADMQFAKVAELSGKSVAQAFAAVDIYRQNDWCDRAIELLEKLIPNVSSNEASALESMIAQIHLFDPESLDMQKASEHANKALELDPDNSEAKWLLGWIDVLDADSLDKTEEKLEKLIKGIGKIEEQVWNKDRGAHKNAIAWGCLAKARAKAAALDINPENQKEHIDWARRAIARSLGLEPAYDMAAEMRKLYNELGRD